MREGRAPSAGLAGLIAAFAAGDTRAAIGRFAALPLPLDAAVRTWVETAVTTFDGSEPGAVRHALRTAGTRGTAATLLLARAAFGAGFETCGLALARAAGPQAPPFVHCAMLLKRGDPEAQALLAQGLERHPAPSQGWTVLGGVLLGLGKTEAAQACFARGEPDVWLAMRRGLLAREGDRLDEARTCFAEAVRLDPAAPRPLFLLGACAQDAGDRAAAADAYRAVLALDPTIAEAAVNLGTVLQEDGDLEGAKVAYGRAVTARADTFGRVAQALSTSPRGELWLDLAALRRSLAG